MNVRLRVVVVVFLLFAACGGSGSGVSHSAATRLHAQVTAIRTAASHTDRRGAARELARLLVTVDQLQAKGELSSDAVTRIRRAAAAVRAELSLLPVPTTTTTTAPPDEGRKHGNGRGKGNKRDESG